MASDEKLPRKLTAILHADVVGYSRLMGEDEDGTHRLLRDYLDLISAAVIYHHGRVVSYAGDAVLADFATVTEALSCAWESQQTLGIRNQDLPDQHRVDKGPGHIRVIVKQIRTREDPVDQQTTQQDRRRGAATD